MPDNMSQQVTRWVDRYGRRLTRAFEQGFPGALEIYGHHLTAEAPNIVTRPGDHPWSVDVTAHIYTFAMRGPLAATLTNPRLAKLGGPPGGGGRRSGRVTAPRGRRFRPLPVGPDPKKRGASGDRDVSGFIDKGYGKGGARSSPGFRSRNIGDTFHAYAWRRARPDLDVYWRQNLLRSLRRG